MIQIVKEGKVVPGQEDRFAALVKKTAAEIKLNDEWLRKNIKVYSEEVERTPVDFEAEARENLLMEGDVWIEETDNGK